MDDLHSPSPDDPTEAELERVRSLLGELDYLDPTRDPGPAIDATGPMPDWVWDRVTGALAHEAAPTRSGHSRAARWAGGLVAASVALVLVGVGVTAVRSGDDAAPVPAQLALPASDAEAGAPAALSYAGIPPMRMVVDSDTSYTMGTLRDQVRTLVSTVPSSLPAISTASLAPAAGAAPAPPSSAASTGADPAATRLLDGTVAGFVASDQSLQDCLDSLTDEARTTAFLIDHATFDGRDADVVVAPDPAAATLVDAKVLEIWVLDPDCTLRLQMWLQRP